MTPPTYIVYVLENAYQLEVLMTPSSIRRRSFFGVMGALPVGVLAARQTTEPARPGVRVAAGESRFGRTLNLPGGNPLSIKVSAQDSAGAFFLAEQPSGAKGGPPRHFHLDVDEWWYCLAGEYVVEVGDQRFRMRQGDSVLGPKGVPHAFAFVGDSPGRLLVGFTPAGKWSSSFAIWTRATPTSAPVQKPTERLRVRSTAS